MANEYLDTINKKETNQLLVSLRSFALENKVPIITVDGIHFLNHVIELKNAKRILEIGSAIGYSAINMAFKTNCDVVTIERDKSMYNLAKKNIEKAGLENKITILFEDALETDESLLGEFDLIFIDAAKAQSVNFFNKYKKLLTDKAVIVTDNLLFHGLVNQEVRDRNLRQLLRKIDNFNKFVVEQEDFTTYIYDIGDGMSLSIKKV
jgi:predicted O-methyltransferase YrrM